MARWIEMSRAVLNARYSGCVGFALFGCWHERFSDAPGAQHSQLQKKCGEIDNAQLAYSGHASAVCPSADIRAAQRIAVPQIKEW
jgi:hypothetical protein